MISRVNRGPRTISNNFDDEEKYAGENSLDVPSQMKKDLEAK